MAEMTLFHGSGTTPFEPVPRLTQIQPSRPILKRSRTPYYPDSKRRRTSPTGAFARLSLSPTSPKPSIENTLAAPDSSPSRRFPCHSTSSHSPTVPLNHFGRGCYERQSPIVHQDLTLNPNNYHFNNTTSVPQDAFNPPIISHQSLSPKEVRMKSGYSAYEIDPNRIFIESLSDGSISPTPSIQQAEDDPAAADQSTFEVDPQIARRISDHQRELEHRSTQMMFSSHQFISDHPTPNNDQQLVLYRRPIWPVLRSPSLEDDHSDRLGDNDRFHEIIDPIPGVIDHHSPPPPLLHPSPVHPIVELEPVVDGHVIDDVTVEVLDPTIPDLSSFDHHHHHDDHPLAAQNVADSMEID